MNTNPTVEKLKELGLVVVVRAPKADDSLMKAIDTVQEAGVKAIEITFTVPNAVAVIDKVNQKFGDAVLLGAGTVVLPSDAAAAVNAGAKYIISPCTREEVISISKALGVAAIPGAYTPTEVMRAWNAGADLVKVFPASIGGPSLIKALKAPYPDIPLVPTGGVNVDNVADFFKAGASGVGVGGNLFSTKLIQAGDFDGLKKLATSFVDAVKAAQQL